MSPEIEVKYQYAKYQSGKGQYNTACFFPFPGNDKYSKQNVGWNEMLCKRSGILPEGPSGRKGIQSKKTY